MFEKYNEEIVEINNWTEKLINFIKNKNSNGAKNAAEIMFGHNLNDGLIEFLSKKNLNNITELKVPDNLIIDESSVMILYFVLNDTKIKSLDLSNANISSKESVRFLIKILHNNQNIKNLNLENTSLNDDNIKILTQYLKIDFFIKTLNLKNNSLTDQGASYILNSLEQNNTISSLNIDQNYIYENSQIISQISNQLRINIDIHNKLKFDIFMYLDTNQDKENKNIQSPLTSNADNSLSEEYKTPKREKSTIFSKKRKELEFSAKDQNKKPKPTTPTYTKIVKYKNSKLTNDMPELAELAQQGVTESFNIGL